MYNEDKLKFGIMGVYKITNTRTQKFYIGSSKGIRKRLNEHRVHLIQNKHTNKYLQNSANKHGIDCFFGEILETVMNVNDLLTVEQKYLDLYYDNQDTCYNMCPKAGSALGRKHSEETKRKISEAHKGKTVSQETRKKHSINAKNNKVQHFKKGKDNPLWKAGKNHPMYGKKHSKASKEKMSASSKGKPNLKSAKPVAQYNLLGELIAIFPSAAEAYRKTGISGIRGVTSGNRKTAGGYIWAYR